MERTNAINPNNKQKKVTAPVNIHSHRGFSSPGPRATLTVRKEKSYNFVKKESLYKLQERNLYSLNSYYASAKENTWNTGGGGFGGDRRKGGEEGGMEGRNIVGGNPVEVTLMYVERLLSRGSEDLRGAS